jgi:hypothetical protein
MKHEFEPTTSMRRLSAGDFAGLGMQDVAYVRRVVVNDEVGWAICAADGTQMGVAPSRELAFAAIKQHELEPLSVH